jgi:ATP-dependent Clp protease adaptor protein ClpS
MPTKQITKTIIAPEVNKTTPPRMHKVILFNDDFTTMEFVIEVFQRFFSKNSELAMQLMLKVHNEGSAICGLYILDVAETKVHQVTEFAKQHGHPLRCITEEN